MTRGWIVLLASLVLLLWRGVEYALIGSFAPLAAFACVLALLCWGWTIGGSAWTRSVWIWGVLFALLGVARVVLTIALSLTPAVSVHGYEALTWPFHVATAFHLFGGLMLMLNRPERSSEVT